MGNNLDVIVCGHLCLDLIPGLDAVDPAALGVPGSLSETAPMSISTGGAVSNTGLALHRLGARVGLMAAVGDDPLGRMTLAFLEQRDPRLTKLVRIRSGAASSYSVVLAPRGRDRSFLHHPGTNATFGVADVDFKERARIFHLGYPPLLPRLMAENGAELRELLALAQSSGAMTSVDMVVPDPAGASGRADWKAILDKCLPHVDLFLPSLDEARFMLRRDEPPARVDRRYLYELTGELLARGAAVAGIKLGERGLYVRTAGEGVCRRLASSSADPALWAEKEHWQPAYAVDVAGTTGAGDAAYAGFLAGMLRGFPPQACLRWASAVAACSVERIDATSGVLTWNDTATRLERAWPTLATDPVN